MVNSNYTQIDPENQIPVTGKEPERVNLCEICSSADQVRLVADPDRGKLMLCADCRRLFGFSGVSDGKN